ncbi:hypothetical protein PMZ80_003684 [Knufia obscura]|uniref:Up-regulated during septation protein 1 domain-containing protein n=1 Tax=Knufia obscura TaxID=1635080 RepID=A0ABR0RVY4_9EURO|nr:hypothetical protein PMZ80_003684 [Knufia obscura]
MQGFNFGIRNSATPSVEDTQSRYVPSSIYSGPGPAEESPLPSQPQQQYYQNGGHKMPSQNGSFAAYEQRYETRPVQPRRSTMLNMNDPVAMHLLMETAIMDSKSFEILSFEELEHLKRERGFLRTKVEGAKRQLGLEKKMFEAEQLMTRLSPNDVNDARQRRPSFFGRKSSGTMQSEKDLISSSDKVEQMAQDVKILETRLQEVDRRIMQHTAGVLQFTHRGLKKNIRKNELPRSPESMASQSRSLSGTDGASDFDERSLYQVPDYVHDLASRSSRRITKDVQPIEDVALRLQHLNTQLHGMIQQAPLAEHFERPPDSTDEGLQGRVGAQIQAHLTYMAQGLEALGTAQESMSREAPGQSVEELGLLTNKLQGMLERTNSVSKSPIIDQDADHGHDLQSQLAYSATVLDRLNQRVDTLLEQKDILTRQIQQQRELNSKSDAQRDAHIRDLTEELEEAQKLQAMSDKDMQQTQDQLGLLMEQLDQAKQNEQLLEKQVGMQDSKALEAERNARKENEARLTQEIEARQHAFTELQADHAKIQNDFELKSQSHLQQLNDVTVAKEQAELQAQQKHDELEALQKEMQDMESQVVQFQTELTMAKAELDGAYGSRAQRAADVSMNPEIRKQIDDLQARNNDLQQELELLSQAHETKGVGSAELQNKVNALQKELKDTIEDYEVMTKASIDNEKERDKLEAVIDELRDRSEALEAQINEDQVKWMGVKNNLPPETTSTMVLKNEFKKMMRDSRAESMKMLKAEQEERKRLEGILRGIRKESAQGTPSKPQPKPIMPPSMPSPTTPAVPTNE